MFLRKQAPMWHAPVAPTACIEAMLIVRTNPQSVNVKLMFKYIACALFYSAALERPVSPVRSYASTFRAEKEFLAGVQEGLLAQKWWIFMVPYGVTQ